MSKLSRTVPKTQCDPYSLVNFTINNKECMPFMKYHDEQNTYVYAMLLLQNSENYISELSVSKFFLAFNKMNCFFENIPTIPTFH